MSACPLHTMVRSSRLEGTLGIAGSRSQHGVQTSVEFMRHSMSFKTERHSNIPLERRGFGDERMSRATNDIGDLSQRGLSACAHFTPSFP